jgi:hypothetical protein
MLRFSGGRVSRGLLRSLPQPSDFGSPSSGRHSRLILLAAAALCAAPCFASLGRAPSAFAGTNAIHQARVLAAGGGTSSGATYSVSTTTLAGGTTVREYVGANGVVFAVAWNGPFLPDLRELLGQHFATFTSEGARQPKAGHGRVRVAQPDVTIESTGHMRAYAGRAWVNSLLPAGFDKDTIE